MKIAVLGDIHSNHIALRAALDRVKKENISVIFFMGDYVSDCARPRETIDLIRACEKRFDCRFVRGNREQYMLDHRENPDEWRLGTAGGSLIYTYERLTAEDMAWFESLPWSSVERFEGLPPILCCHGYPDKLRGVPFRHPDLAEKWLSETEAQIYLCAHTHKPRLMELSEGRLLVNTGSVGMAVWHPGLAEITILEGEKGAWRVNMITEPYDVQSVLETIKEDEFSQKSGLWATMMMKQLTEGGEGGVPMVDCALAKAKKRGIEGGVGDVPEEIWREAAIEVGILESGGPTEA